MGPGRARTSRSLASSCGSVENLNVSTRCGGIPLAPDPGHRGEPDSQPLSHQPRRPVRRPEMRRGFAHARQPVAGDGILDGGDGKIPVARIMFVVAPGWRCRRDTTGCPPAARCCAAGAVLMQPDIRRDRGSRDPAAGTRVQALAGALCITPSAVTGITNKSLRARMKSILKVSTPPSASILMPVRVATAGFRTGLCGRLPLK